MNWLVISLVLSVALTLALNLAVRAFPRGAQRVEERTVDWLETRARDDRPRVQVFFPWKAMLVGSIALTVVLNLLAALAR